MNHCIISAMVVYQISGYTSDLLTVNIPFWAQPTIPVVLHFEYASFRGQTAPTGSFSAKTLPVGPEYHAFGTSNGTIRQTFEQNSACRSSERFYQLTFAIDPHMFCRNSSFNCLVVVQFLKSPCMSQMIEIHTEINI